MRFFDQNWTRENVANYAHRMAARWAYDGRMDDPMTKQYLKSCTHCYRPDGVILIFTRDFGHHSSGWWKNPDYERCFHLSISYRDPVTGVPVPHDKKISGAWVEEFFHESKRLVWAEPPFSQDGKSADCWHFRVFMHTDWKTPLLPSGEVYSKRDTPANWKSFSDRTEQDEKDFDTWLNQL